LVKNNSSLDKYADFTCRNKSRCLFKPEDNELIKSVNVFLKYYLSEACNMMRHNYTSVAVYYSKKYNESLTH